LFLTVSVFGQNAPTPNVTTNTISIQANVEAPLYRLPDGNTVRALRVEPVVSFAPGELVEFHISFLPCWVFKDMEKARDNRPISSKAFDHGPFIAGVKYRPFFLPYDGGEARVGIGYEFITKSDGYQKTAVLLASALEGAYISPTHSGINHRFTLTGSMTYDALSVSSYVQYRARTKEQDNLRLGNVLSFGGEGGYTVGQIGAVTLTPVLGIMWRDQARAKIRNGAEAVLGTGGSETWVLPGLKFGLSQSTLSVGVNIPVTRNLGAYMPRELASVFGRYNF